jgi:rhodanese-related sulfurtransferase
MSNQQRATLSAEAFSTTIHPMSPSNATSFSRQWREKIKTESIPWRLCLFLISSPLLMLCLLAGPSIAAAQEPNKVLSIEAYDMLNTVPDTYLIDVRTRAEYQFVGHPMGAYLFPYQFFTGELGKTGESHGYLLSVKNKAFVEEIGKVFKKTDNLLIICRDGMRSALAAKELLDGGFKNVFDVEDGFEGPEFPVFKDANKDKYYRQLAKRNKIWGFNHRRHYGWQWWGLPWTYEIDPKFIYPPDLRPPEKK